MKNKIITIVVLVIVVAIGWYGFSKKGGKVELAEGETIKIGVVTPLTGDAGIYGEPALNVYKLAVKEINAAGGVDGHQIELIAEDGNCTGADAISALQKLITIHKVQVVIGGFCSGESLAMIPVAEQAKVSLLSPGSSSPDLTDASKFFARNYPSDNTQGVVLAQAAASRNLKKVAFIQEQTDYALGVYDAFAEEFESLDGTIIKEEFPTETADFRSQLNKLKAENPDALFISVQTTAAAQRIMKQMTEMNWKPQLIVSDVVSDQDTLTLYRDIMEGALGALFGENSDDPKFQALIANYKTEYGADVPYPQYAQTEYDAPYLVADAIREVGYDGAKIAAWLHNVKNWQGASGIITIDKTGDRAGGHELRIVRNGQLVAAE